MLANSGKVSPTARTVGAEVEEAITQQLGPTNTTRLKALPEKVADTARRR